jgi:hypothetical protein
MQTDCGLERPTQGKINQHQVHCKQCKAIRGEKIGVEQESPIEEIRPRSFTVTMSEANSSVVIPTAVQRYKELPPPIVKHLEQVFGDWLNHFDVWMEYKKDFGGYGIYIKVPERFSTEWHREKRVQYDNITRKPIVGTDGKQVVKEVVFEDIRSKNLRDIEEAKKWINLVKEHIITHAYQKGIHLPSTNAKLDETKATLDEYTKALHA